MLRRKGATEEDGAVRDRSRKSGTVAFTLGIVTMGVFVVGGAIFIGRSDDGPINVAATIQESNQVVRENGGDGVEVSSVPQTFQNMPNGGLVSSDNQEQQQTEETSVSTDSTTNATSTNETGTSIGGSPVASENGEGVVGETVRQ